MRCWSANRKKKKAEETPLSSLLPIAGALEYCPACLAKLVRDRLVEGLDASAAVRNLFAAFIERLDLLQLGCAREAGALDSLHPAFLHRSREPPVIRRVQLTESPAVTGAACFALGYGSLDFELRREFGAVRGG